MDYMIVNPSKSVYIRLDNGRPVTCGKSELQRFEYSKARNIVSNLPKTMHKFHFQVKAIPEIPPPRKPKDEVRKERYLQKTYVISNEVQGWLDRVRQCNGLATDASKRKSELVHDLSNIDLELSNCLHEIELSGNMNACDGYKEYKRTKLILEKRRVIKDELSVVDCILNCNLASMASDRVQKVVDGLHKRKFTFREVDLDKIYIEE